MKKLPFKNSIFILVALFFALVSCSPKKQVKTEEWIQLFNRKDLSGWTVKMKGYAAGENFGNTFRVEDSLLKVRYDQYENFGDRFAHIFYNDTFSHYKIRVEYRFVGEQCPGGASWAYRNSGIMVHGQSPESMLKDQDFPVSIEVQLLGGDSIGERSTLNLCTPGTNVVMNGNLVLEHCTNSSSKTYRGEQWVTAEVEVRGSEIINHLVNGENVMTYTLPQLDERDSHYMKLLPANGDKILSRGTISLQSESHPCDFRKVELLVIKD